MEENKMENHEQNKYVSAGKELKFLHYVIYAGLAASFLQLVHTFGKGEWFVLSAWLKACFIEGIICLLTRYVARANAIKMSAGVVWSGLIVATVISVLANVRYEIAETLAVKAAELHKLHQLEIPLLSMTWKNISAHVDVVNWIEAIAFSGIVPIFVLVMAFVILIAEKTQTAMVKAEETRLKLNAYQNRRYHEKKSEAVDAVAA